MFLDTQQKIWQILIVDHQKTCAAEYIYVYIIYAVEYNMYNIQHEDTATTLSQHVKECQISQNFECDMSNYFQHLPLLKEVGK